MNARAPDAAQRKRCAVEPGPKKLSVQVGPGSAAQREERCTASGTRKTSAPAHRAFDLTVGLIGRQENVVVVIQPERR
jgi:hypothetical protein